MLNFGLSGAISDEYEGIVEKALAAPDLKAVIFYTGYNDIFIKEANKAYGSFRRRSGAALAFLIGHTVLGSTASEKYVIWKSNRPSDGDEERSRRLEEEFRRGMSAGVVKLRERGVKVVLVPEVLMAQRFAVHRDYTDYREKYVRIPSILADIATESNSEFVDLQRDFEVIDFRSYFVDPVHLTDRGNLMLAELIFKRSKTLQNLVTGESASKRWK